MLNDISSQFEYIPAEYTFVLQLCVVSITKAPKKGSDSATRNGRQIYFLIFPLPAPLQRLIK